MVEYVQDGGAPAEHVEHWHLKIVESTLKYTAFTFRSNNNASIATTKQTSWNNWKRLSIVWDPSSSDKLDLMWKLLSGIYQQKWTLASPEDLAWRQIYLLRSAQKIINTHELDYQFHVGYNQILLHIDEFQRNDSGWVVDQLRHIYLTFCNFYNNFINLIVKLD